MAFPSFLSRAAAILLVAAAILLPSLSVGAADDCCPAPGAPGGCSDLCLPSEGASGSDGEGHAKALCDCGTCDVPSLVERPVLPGAPALAERLAAAHLPVPPSEAPSTPERPPSA